MRFFSALALASIAAAHFTLDYPPTRGFDEDNEPKAICGGFDTIKNRTSFPLSGGQLQITSHHTKASVFAEISFNSNPNSFTQFNTSSDGKNYPFLIPVNQIAEGPACWNLNVSSLNVPEAKNGTNATIVVLFDGGDGTLYQCADLVLSSDTNVPSGSIQSGLKCQTLPVQTSNGADATTSTTGATPTETGSAVHSSTVLTGGVTIAFTAAIASFLFI